MQQWLSWHEPSPQSHAGYHVSRQTHTWSPITQISGIWNKDSFNKVNPLHLFSCQWGCTTSWCRCRRHKKYFRDKQIPCGTWIWACWPAWQGCSTVVYLLLRSQWFHIVYSGKNATRYIKYVSDHTFSDLGRNLTFRVNIFVFCWL